MCAHAASVGMNNMTAHAPLTGSHDRVVRNRDAPAPQELISAQLFRHLPELWTVALPLTNLFSFFHTAVAVTRRALERLPDEVLQSPVLVASTEEQQRDLIPQGVCISSHGGIFMLSSGIMIPPLFSSFPSSTTSTLLSLRTGGEPAGWRGGGRWWVGSVTQA